MHRSSFLSSFAKGLRVLETFDPESPRQTIAEVSRASGLDRATARRCLITLHELGYADYDGKFFTLTPRVLRLGVGALAGLPLARKIQPWIDQLSEKLKQSVSVAILDETEIVYIARAAQRKIMSVGLMPGSRLPAHCTSLGRVLLAALPEAEAREILLRSDLAPRTRFSLTDPKEIMERLAAATTLGYAVVDQEVELGLRSIAVPIHDARGRTAGALNAGVAITDATVHELETSFLHAMLKVQAGLRSVLP